MADLGDNIRGANEEIQSLYDQLRGVTSEIKGQATEITKSRAAFRAFEKGAQDLKLQFEGINRLSDDQVKKLHEQLIEQKAIAAQEVQRLKSQNSYIQNLDEELELLKEQGDNQQNISDYALQQIQNAQDLTDEQKAILSSFYDQTNVMDDIISQAQEELDVREDVNNAMGIAGGLFKGLNEMAGGFGKAFKLDKVQKDMEKFADETIRAEGSVSRLSVLGVGLKSAFSNLGSFLTDPTVVFGAIAKGFTEVEKEQQNFRRLTGQNADAFRGINDSLTTTSQYLKGMVTLSKELGVNANIVFPPETVTTVTELVEEMGMAGNEAAKLAQLSQISGTNLKENAKQVEKGFKNFVQQNGVALNFGDIMSDVANVSAATSVSLGNNPKKIQDAALAAANLGLSMAQVERISESLLNFQTSIEKEMEAELLTGQQLNLEKAREFALAGDIAGVANEIGKNQAINNAFASGNVIQQKAIAEALGMSREDMAQMILQQKIQSGLSTEQAAKAANISLEEAQRLTTQQQITKSIEKMSQAIAPILSVISSLLSNSFVLYTTMATLAAVYINKLIPAVGKYVLTQVKSLNLTKLQNIAEKAGNVVRGATITLMNSEFMVKTKDFILSKAKAAQDAIINGYMVVRNTLMNTAIGRYLALGAAKLIDTIRTWAGVGATFAQAGANATLSTSQAILGTTGAAAGGGMAAAGAGLGAFGAAAAPAIPIILAVGAALLLASPAIYAFSFVIKALGEIIIGALQSIPPIITAISEGFTSFLGAITFEKAAALPLVGVGLVALASGVVAMAAVTPFLPLAALGILGISYALTPLAESTTLLGPSIETLSSNLISLASVTPQLFGVAAGLGAISAGLASMAVTGLLALPVIGALTALGTVSGALSSIFGGEEGDKEDKGSMKAIEQKLDQLIAVISAGGDVYIDGAKVGKTVALATSRIG